MWLPGCSLAAGHRPAPQPHTTVHPACAVACLCRTVLGKPVNVDSSKAQALLGLSYIPLVSRLVRSSHALQQVSCPEAAHMIGTPAAARAAEC
jgi:hypothetical protein